jgi:hypothetical protein
LDPVEELSVSLFNTREALDDETQLIARDCGHDDFQRDFVWSLVNIEGTQPRWRMVQLTGSGWGISSLIEGGEVQKSRVTPTKQQVDGLDGLLGRRMLGQAGIGAVE